MFGIDLDSAGGDVSDRRRRGSGARLIRPDRQGARLPDAAADREQAFVSLRLPSGRGSQRGGPAAQHLGVERRDRLWSVEFVRPVPGIANSAFGTRSVSTARPRNAHGGADS